MGRLGVIFLLLFLLACRRAETPITETQVEPVAPSAQPIAKGGPAGGTRPAETHAPTNVTLSHERILPIGPREPESRNAAPPPARRSAIVDDGRAVVGAPIRRADLIAARDTVNAYRRRVGLPEFAFADPEPTTIRALHMTELRDAVAEARSARGLPVEFTEPVARGSVVRAQHLAEVTRAAVDSAPPTPTTVTTCARFAPGVCTTTQPCVPPPACRFTDAPVPFDAPVRYDGEVRRGGEISWRWVKIGEPSRPCTDAERQEKGSYGRGCATNIGEGLLYTTPFRVIP
jgi:hypothetical protein